MIHPVPKPIKRVKVRASKQKFGKSVRVKDPDYLAHIRKTCRCLCENRIPANGKWTDVEACNWFTSTTGRTITEAAHVRGKGAGGGDEQVVPLCGKHHRWGKHSLHNLNVAGFDKFWGISVRKIARSLRREYLTRIKA